MSADQDDHDTDREVPEPPGDRSTDDADSPSDENLDVELPASPDPEALQAEDEHESPSAVPSDDRPSSSSPPFESDDEGRRRQRHRLEGLLRESFRKAVEKGVEAGIGAIGSGVDALEKSVEAGRGTMKQASHSFRGVVDEMKLPKEAASYLLNQVDETKNVLIRAVSREVRDFLSATDIAHELQRALTSLSFEIRTEIRFVPNDKGVMKAEVKSRAVPHRGSDEDGPDARPKTRDD